MNTEHLQEEVDRKYEEFIGLLRDEIKEHNDDDKFFRDIKLIEARVESTKIYFNKFCERALTLFPEYGFQLSPEHEAKRFAILYAYYLEQFREQVEGADGTDTRMSIYKIVSSCEATIVSIAPITKMQANGPLEQYYHTMSKLNGWLAQFYALEMITDWISSENTHSQDLLYIGMELYQDRFIKELSQEHRRYLQKKVYYNLKTRDAPFETFLMAQYWKIFHYYMFDPRTMEKESI